MVDGMDSSARMIPHDTVCEIAQRIREYYLAHDTTALRELFDALGVDEDVAAHYFVHAQELAPNRLQTLGFGYGLLMGLLTGIEVDPPKLSDHDLDELLRG